MMNNHTLDDTNEKIVYSNASRHSSTSPSLGYHQNTVTLIPVEGSATLNFTGVAVYVQFVRLTNGGDFLASIDGNDYPVATTYSDIVYGSMDAAIVWSAKDLPDQPHTLSLRHVEPSDPNRRIREGDQLQLDSITITTIDAESLLGADPFPQMGQLTPTSSFAEPLESTTSLTSTLSAGAATTRLATAVSTPTVSLSTDNQSSQNKSAIIVGGTFGAILSILLLASLFYFYRRAWSLPTAVTTPPPGHIHPFPAPSLRLSKKYPADEECPPVFSPPEKPLGEKPCRPKLTIITRPLSEISESSICSRDIYSPTMTNFTRTQSARTTTVGRQDSVKTENSYQERLKREVRALRAQVEALRRIAAVPAARPGPGIAKKRYPSRPSGAATPFHQTLDVINENAGTTSRHDHVAQWLDSSVKCPQDPSHQV